MTDLAHTPCWYDELRHCLCTDFILKFAGISVFMSVFMWLYFYLLGHPQFPVRVVPLQIFDHWVGLHPWAIFPYISLWPYATLVPGLLRRGPQMRIYVCSALLLAVAGLGIFWLVPSRIPELATDWENYPLIAWLKATDTTGNACPSLHVAYATLSAFWLSRILRRVKAPSYAHVLNIAWCVLIIWSTMALDQHTALDVEMGLMLGLVVTWLGSRFWPHGECG